jgi:hypothetical protein
MRQAEGVRFIEKQCNPTTVSVSNSIASEFGSSRKQVEPTGSKTLESVEVELPLERRKLGLTEPSECGEKGKEESRE